MKFVVVVVHWNYYFLVASCCLHLCYRMDIALFINVNHSGERMGASVVSNGLQLLTISTLVNFHYIFSILVQNLLHLLILVPPIANHINTAPTTILLLRLLQLFVHRVPNVLLISSKVTFSFVIVIVQFIIYFRPTEPRVRSRAVLEITKHASLRVCIRVIAPKLDVSLVPCLVDTLLAVNGWK